jgi:leucyl-tRNA synthetase
MTAPMISVQTDPVARSDAPAYDFRTAEPRWQRAWAARQCFEVPDVPDDARPK